MLFVRDVLPDERVRVQVTEIGPKGRFLRADLREVLEPSAYRVTPSCPVAGDCGGCDFQHATPVFQRELKARVVAEQLTRLGRVDLDDVRWDRTVAAVPDPDPQQPGLGWRTRVRFAVDAEGVAGLRRHRSHEVVGIADCPIAHELIDVGEITGTRWPGVDEVSVAVSPSSGERVVTIGRGGGQESLHLAAAGRRWQVSGGGFWQVHPAAADTLVRAVLDLGSPQPGEHLVDLYAGVGLFSGAWADLTGGRVDAVEGHRLAAQDAVENLADLPEAYVHADDVERFCRQHPDIAPDVVVLDPPRVGARRTVLEPVSAWGSRAIVYVACDPAALGRDVATLGELGYRFEALQSFDLFPMTHHVESVALFTPRL